VSLHLGMLIIARTQPVIYPMTNRPCHSRVTDRKQFTSNWKSYDLSAARKIYGFRSSVLLFFRSCSLRFNDRTSADLFHSM